jgi:fucose permease
VVTKISILLLYLNIAKQSQRFFRISSYVTLAVVSIGGVILTFITAFHCSPVQAAYNLDIKNFSCISIQKTLLSSAPINIATDLAILVLPIPVLTTLPLPLLRKSIVILSFILGVILVAVVDVARLYYLQLAAIGSDQLDSNRLSTGLDFSYNAGMALLWSAVEVNVAIVGASIPTLTPLLKRARDTDRGALVRPRPEREPTDSVSLSELQHQPSWTAGSASKGPSQSISTMLPGDQEPWVSARDFPTTQDTERGTQQPRARPIPQFREASIRFGFINMERPKCIADMRGSECIKYCAIINTVLFLNGFIYVMLFSINGDLPIVVNLTQAIGISSASYGGAGIFSPFLGYAILHHFGFKVTIVTSLAICCVGTLIFWPSGALGSYPAFIVSNVVVGVALGCLEITADAFNALCGPPEYAEIRVLLGAGIENFAGTLSLVLAQYAISIDMDDARSLISLQWAYLALALFAVLLGLVFYYIPLPEATDMDLQTRPDLLWTDPSRKYLGIFPVIFTPLPLSFLSAFFAAGALASLRDFIGNVLSNLSASTESSPMLSISDFQIVLTAIYTCGLFFFAFLCLLIPPRLVLFWAHACGIIFGALIVGVQFPSVRNVQVLTLVVSIFQGPIPNLCWAIALRGLGQWTKLAACFLYIGASLGASIWPWVMLTVANSHSAQYAFCIIIALFTAGIFFPLYLSLERATQHQPPGWRAVAKVIQRAQRA